MYQVEIARLGSRISAGPKLGARRVRSLGTAVVGKNRGITRKARGRVADIVGNRAKGFVKINKKAADRRVLTSDSAKGNQKKKGGTRKISRTSRSRGEGKNKELVGLEKRWNERENE